MTPLILVLVVVVIVIAVVVMRRKTTIELPPETSEPKAIADAKPSAKAELAKAAPAKEEPAKAQPAKAEVAKAEPIAAAPEPAKAEPEVAKATEAAKTQAAPSEEVPKAIAIDPSIAAEAAKRTSIPTASPANDVSAAKKAADEDASALKKGLSATRTGFFGRLKELFTRKPELDPAAIDEVEEILLSSDVGVETTKSLLDTLRARHAAGALGSSDALQATLEEEAKRILTNGASAIRLEHKPTVLLFVGVNGVGKTTTIGKLASKFKDEGKKVLLAAGDTYRAAAVIQLEAWGRRVGCDVLKGKDRADPSGVIFDAVKKGTDEGYDVVLCDTAGRLQTKMPLMDELAKMGRSVEKATGRPADETLLVLDATTGQNAIQQATQFGSTLPLTGIVLTKLDGTAKGGVILGIVDQQKVPVRYVGIGERVEDLRVFDAGSFVTALFAPGDEA